MKTLLTILLILFLTAEAVIWYQIRKLIRSWGEEVEDDAVLTDEEQRYIEIRAKILHILSIVSVILIILRFVVFDLLPLIRG